MSDVKLIQDYAKETYDHWDCDRTMKVGKRLLAISNELTNYNPEINAAWHRLERQEEINAELLAELKRCREWHESRKKEWEGRRFHQAHVLDHDYQIINITAAITKAEGAGEEAKSCLHCGNEEGDNHDTRCPLNVVKAPAAEREAKV